MTATKNALWTRANNDSETVVDTGVVRCRKSSRNSEARREHGQS